MAKFGYFGTMVAKEGKGKQLLDILIRASILMSDVDGCFEYTVSVDSENNEYIHIFEVWKNKAVHDQSLQLEDVKQLIQQALPLLSDEKIPGKNFYIKQSFHY